MKFVYLSDKISKILKLTEFSKGGYSCPINIQIVKWIINVISVSYKTLKLQLQRKQVHWRAIKDKFIPNQIIHIGSPLYMHYSKVNQTNDLNNELFILSGLGGRGSVCVSVCVSLCSVLLLGPLLCLRWKSSLIFITSSTDKSPSLLQGIPREENKNNLKID